MPELYKLAAGGQIEKISEHPFTDETTDLEDFLVKNPDLLGEGTSIVSRQVVTPAGRLDLLALDHTVGAGQIAVVELKNVPTDVPVLLQVLRYASWAKNNQDSVRLLLTKAGIQDVDKVELHPRITVVAPEVRTDVAELAQYISAFEFTFIELQRFVSEQETIVAVSRPTPPTSPAAGVSAQEEWNWLRYEHELGWKPVQLQIAKWLFERVEGLVEEKGWQLHPRFRKGYVPFQLGGTKNVVGIEPRWAGGCSIWFRLPKPPGDMGLLLPEGLAQSNWSQQFKTQYINVVTVEFDLKQLSHLFDAADAHASGAQ